MFDNALNHSGKTSQPRDGIWEFPLVNAAPDADAAIAWYQHKGGTRFLARAAEPGGALSMSALDTPVYRHHLLRMAESLGGGPLRVVDVGAGDGRHTLPLLEAGHWVIAVDPVTDSLARLRENVRARATAASATADSWLNRLLLVRADARTLPVASGWADACVAIETLYYLNEDYARGARECARVLRGGGQALIAERSWEGGLLTQLLYRGVDTVAALPPDSREVWDGPPGNDTGAQVRSRSFTEAELLAQLRAAGLTPEWIGGTSTLALAAGYLNGRGTQPEDTAARPTPATIAGFGALLMKLAETGTHRRTHLVRARKL